MKYRAKICNTLSREQNTISFNYNDINNYSKARNLAMSKRRNI